MKALAPLQEKIKSGVSVSKEKPLEDKLKAGFQTMLANKQKAMLDTISRKTTLKTLKSIKIPREPSQSSLGDIESVIKSTTAGNPAKPPIFKHISAQQLRDPSAETGMSVRLDRVISINTGEQEADYQARSPSPPPTFQRQDYTTTGAKRQFTFVCPEEPRTLTELSDAIFHIEREIAEMSQYRKDLLQLDGVANELESQNNQIETAQFRLQELKVKRAEFLKSRKTAIV